MSTLKESVFDAKDKDGNPVTIIKRYNGTLRTYEWFLRKLENGTEIERKMHDFRVEPLQ